MAYGARVKRVLLGRALRTGQGPIGVGRVRAVSSLASDALSSNVYATQEILLVLAAGGAGMLVYGPAVAASVVVVFTIVVIAYRYTVRYATGGGADYEVAAKNLGPDAAVLVAAAMLIDFALTLAVSVAAIGDTVISVVPDADDARVTICMAALAVLALISLRSGSTVGAMLHIGTYAFVAAVLVMTGVAAVETLVGDAPRAASADWDVVAPAAAPAGLALALLLARSFSSGSIAVTGVEAVGTGVPAFREPRGARAATTLIVLGVLSMITFVSITWLALLTGVRVAADPADLIGLPPGEPQQTLVVQVADAVLGNAVAVGVVAGTTILILLAAGSSAFRSFSVMTSLLGRDGYLPRQLSAQGDRLVYSNGIVLLALAAAALLLAFDASLTTLIQLYVVGVFLALTVGQAGMVRHWAMVLRRRPPARQRAAARRARAIAMLACAVTAAVLAVVLMSKLTAGAWVVVVLIPTLAWVMRRVRDHYDTVEAVMSPQESVITDARQIVHALILVSRIHKPTLRAVAYARASRPSTLHAVTVAVDTDEAAQLQREWDQRQLNIPLEVLGSPFREINSPVMRHVAGLRRSDPDSLLMVYVPEYVVEHRWEQLLHNRSAARLKRRLMSLPNVVVVSVPWQLAAPDEPVGAPGGGPGIPATAVPAATGDQGTGEVS